ncbi:MAG TPA: isopentenyl phosphate kinase [Candidatus Thermoplasmatota archaeon]|nr:isopentenyl phosphate kinase [Candidatus Thermoplasmatota archaeon]
MKLGGSVLTDKAQYRTARPDVLARLARELAKAEGPLCVVHGAGSYGHVLAKRHGLKDGKGEPAHAARVHADVRLLQSLVCDALQDAGLHALALSTSDLGLDGVPPRARDALALGFVPVIPGDVVLDAQQRWRILSGDVLMVQLAKALQPRRAVFVTDVDGIHDRWPDGKLLPRIGPGDAPFAGEARGDDVTGGMAGKLRRARDVAATGCEVLVVNGTAPGRVADAVAMRDVVGTLVAGA